MQVHHTLFSFFCISLSLSHILAEVSQNLPRLLDARSKISGYRTSRPNLDQPSLGRCDEEQINLLRILLRQISQWSQWAIDATPQSERRAARVSSDERFFFARIFDQYNIQNRNLVRRYFQALQLEVDNSPGGRPRWPFGRGRVKINCSFRSEFFCQDLQQLSHQDQYLQSVGQVILVSFLNCVIEDPVRSKGGWRIISNAE